MIRDDTIAKMKELSTPEEQWYQVPDHEEYWVSTLGRALSTKHWESAAAELPGRLLKVRFCKEVGKTYINVQEYGKHTRIFIDDVLAVYTPTPRPTTTSIITRKPKVKADDRIKRIARRKAIWVLGSDNHQDLNHYTQMFIDVLLWGENINR